MYFFQFLTCIPWGPRILFWEMEKKDWTYFCCAAPCLGGEEAGAGFCAPWLPTMKNVPPPRTRPQYWTTHRSSLAHSLWPSEAYIVGTGSPNDAPDLQTIRPTRIHIYIYICINICMYVHVYIPSTLDTRGAHVNLFYASMEGRTCFSNF